MNNLIENLYAKRFCLPCVNNNNHTSNVNINNNLVNDFAHVSAIINEKGCFEKEQ